MRVQSPLRRLAALLTTALATGPARAQDFWVNPGSMGPNALPSWPLEAPWNEGLTELHLGVAGQRTAAGDLSGTPWYRLDTPFGRGATMISEGRTTELWRLSEATRADWGVPDREGLTVGDLSFGAKFHFIDGGAQLPHLGARTLCKTTTGKGYENRRFINAPAYHLDLLVAQPLGTHLGLDWLALGQVGFLAWQQGTNGQNDAMSWAGGLRAQGERLRATVEARGYFGWQKLDKPVVVGLRLEQMLGEHLGLFGTYNVGLRDAPRHEAFVGGILRFDAPLPIKAEK